MEEDTQQALEKIGMTKGEASVFLTLNRQGSDTAGKIAKLAHVSNSKVYDILDRLHRKGLVSSIQKEGVLHFKACSIEQLFTYLDEKKEEIEQDKKVLEKIAPYLNAQKAEDTTFATIYQGYQGVRTILLDIIARQKEGYELLTFGSDENVFANKFPQLVSMYIREVKENNFSSRALFAKGTVPVNPSENLRVLPKGLLSPIRIAVYAERTAIFDFSEPVSVILIMKQNVADGYRDQFEHLWSIAEPPETN